MDDEFYFNQTTLYKTRYNGNSKGFCSDSTDSHTLSSQEVLYDQYDTCDFMDLRLPYIKESKCTFLNVSPPVCQDSSKAVPRKADTCKVSDLHPFFYETQGLYRQKLNQYDSEDSEPIKLERFVDIWEKQLDKMIHRLRVQFDERVRLRRDRKKLINDPVVSYFEHEIDLRLTPISMRFEEISHAADVFFDILLGYIFSCKDLESTEGSSQRHRAIGILLDGYSVFMRFVRDAETLMGEKPQGRVEKSGQLKFLAKVESSPNLTELCKRDWVSYAGHAMKRKYRSLQGLS